MIQRNADQDVHSTTDYSSSSRVNTNVPWDPGVRLAHDQRQIHSPLRPVLPAPSRSGPSDLRAHHKDFERTSSFSRVSTKGVRPNISAQRDRMDVNTDEDEDEGEDEDDDEDGDDAPFVPRDSSTSTTRFQHDRDHRLDLHATRLTHPSGLHISSHATRMATDPVRRSLPTFVLLSSFSYIFCLPPLSYLYIRVVSFLCCSPLSDIPR
ncbi:hypothetical protein B0F90DRAFT_1754230 [Multifurca ochricompacta]|uniref:Uncharacterized protein n=1 Tax=Multifurca ochricompacta TaxID=376703 RepID=A0AAD4QKU2_9AGAM|nr:hypothetical protein B0F90DRAFT_1754230 [Multifurca ochricompacta]